jgi:HAD superfamily hydrolase (TIGR01509 family)
MGNRERAGVLLDLDGTLIDTNYLHTIAWSRALGDLGEWAPMNAIHRLVGMGGDQLVPELLGHDVAGASDAWRSRYDEIRDEAQPFPRAKDLVVRLHDLGLVVVLATSAPEDLLNAAVDLLGIDGCFDRATSADDVESSKPDPAIFQTAISIARLDPERVLTIGDSIWDIRAARAAGIGCVGLETGGFSRHELSEDGAIAVYRDPGELLGQLLTSPVATLLR